MSTIAFGALTRKRIEAAPGTSREQQPPGMRTYVDALAALVPAEVLAVHAIILSFATKTVEGQTTITDKGTIAVVFWALICLSVLLYFFGRLGKKLQRWDALRALIPPLAFVGWTMLQKVTAFDTIVPDMAEIPRIAIALIGAVVLSAASSLLANIADMS
jgi:uncharacterized membrane protein YvlD (DUF360 family)